MQTVTNAVKGWVLGMVIGLAACATSPEPFEYQNTNEVKPGRGVFTGEDGTWTIYRQPMPAETQTAPTEDAEDKTEKKAVEGQTATDSQPASD